MRNVWKPIAFICVTFAILGFLVLRWMREPEKTPTLPMPQPQVRWTREPDKTPTLPMPQPQVPKPEGRMVDIPVNNKDTDMCKEWTGEPHEAKEWWHWACLLNRYFATVDYTCKQPVNAGNWKMCGDVPWAPPTPCLVYSVGIANYWAFDDFMYQNMSCTVHSFDPSMGKPHFMRNPKNLFYNIGLGWEDNNNFSPRRDVYVGEGQKWQMMTLESIMKYLGHQDIRQFAIEWHIFPNLPNPSEFEKMYRNLQKLRDMGFYAFHNAPFKWINLKDSSKFNSQSEMSYVNMHFLVEDKISAAHR